MKIDAIEIHHVAMPMAHAFKTSFGNTQVLHSLLVKLVSGDQYGWGEATAWQYPAYCPEFAAGQFLLSQQIIAPALLGKEIASGSQLQAELAWIKGNNFAKAQFDLAWWDLFAKLQNRPLWQVLGGRGPEVETGEDFGILDRVETLIDKMRTAEAQGYKRIKLKYGPGWEIDMIAAVRKAFPDLPIHVDCNSAYTLADVKMLKQLDQFHLAMIEQPLMHDDLLDHAALQAQIQTPICLDESITSASKARKAAQLKSCRWVNIKLGRTGGITNALEVNRTCQAAGIPCWVGSMADSGIGASHNVAFASLPNIEYPADIFPTRRFYVRDLATPEMVHSAPSMFRASDKPGIGVEPDPEMLAAQTVNRADFKR